MPKSATSLAIAFVSFCSLAACRQLGALARAEREWGGSQRVAAHRVEQLQKCQMESRSSRSGKLVAGRLGESGFLLLRPCRSPAARAKGACRRLSSRCSATTGRPANCCGSRRPPSANRIRDTHATNGFASASPCTDGEYVYAHFGSRGLFCYTMNGDLKWKREDFGKMDTLNNFGEGSSPTLEGDKILVPWDHRGPSALYALDKRTGKTVWMAPRDEPTCWATPLVVEIRRPETDRHERAEVCTQLRSGIRERIMALRRTDDAPGGLCGRRKRIGFCRQRISGRVYGRLPPGWRQGTSGGPTRWPGRSTTIRPMSLRLSFRRGASISIRRSPGCFPAWTPPPASRTTWPNGCPALDSTYASPIAAGGHVYLTGRNGTTVVIDDADALTFVATNTRG